MPIFKGKGPKDLDQFWFVAKVVWKAQQIDDNDMKKEQLITTLQDRALSWYIKNNMVNPVASLVATKNTLNVEFKKPKLQSQCITKIKEIKQVVNEIAWDVDQRLKCLIGQANFHISNELHKEWYIATLFPHLILPLSQKNIGTQAEALEIVMKLEASPVQDTHIGVQ